MPTPTAVLKAAQLLSQGTGSEKGLGDLVIVDIGGATTDVHSIGMGNPRSAGGRPQRASRASGQAHGGGRPGDPVQRRHDPEAVRPGTNHEKCSTSPSRTLLEQAGQSFRCVETLPESVEDRDLDFALASCAAQAAMERHAGTIETLWGPQGQYYVQHGKDLTGIEYLIGTGGIFIHHPDAGDISGEDCFSRPKSRFPCAPRARPFTPMPGIACLPWDCWPTDSRKRLAGSPRNI